MGARDHTLKKIPVSELRLGMHLHALDGPWLDHPFWRTRFVLRDPADLQALVASKVRECWIDAALGVDVAPPPADNAVQLAAAPAPEPAPATTAAPTALPAPAAPPPARAPAPAAPEPRVAMREEMHRAALLCQRSREAVSSMFAEARLGHALNAEHCQPLVNDITESVLRNPGALVSLARLKTQDDYTYMHSVAVCALMVALGRQMGFDDAACRDAGLAGLLHDLGKAAVPLDILNKPGKLTDAEFAIIRTHPVRGHAMLQEAKGANEAAMDVVLNHHERTDGRGYPRALPAEQLSLIARMGAVCDVYDAITSNRPYKDGWDPADSVSKMASWKGQFDDTVFRHFVRSLGIYPNGALVRLASGRLAVVIEQNAKNLTVPVVKVFFDTRTEMPLPPKVIDLATDQSDRITDREPPGRWNFPHLDALWAGEEVLKKSR